MHIPIRTAFATRMFLIFTLFMTLVCSVAVALLIPYQSRDINRRLDVKGRFLATVLAANCRLGVFSENERLMRTAIQGIANQEEVVEIDIYEAQGRRLQTWTRNGAWARRPGAEAIALPAEAVSGGRIARSDPAPVWEFWRPVTAEAAYDSEEALFFGNRPGADEARTIGFVRVTLDRSGAERRINTLALYALVIGVAFWAVGTGVVFFISRTLSSPLRNLYQGVMALESGDPFVPLKIQTGDEIGRLGNAFNRMAATLMRREARLEAARKTLETVIEASPLAIVTVDREGKVDTWNRAAEVMFGWRAEEVRGRPCPLEALAGDGQNCGLARRVADESAPAAGEKIRCSRKEGRMIDIALWTASLRDDGGDIDRYLGIFQDITNQLESERKLRESEALYRTLVETSPDAIALTDLNGTYIMANTQSARFRGYETVQEMMDDKDSVLHHCDSAQQEAIRGYIRTVLRHGIVRNLEYSMRRKDGAALITNLNLSLVRDGRGKLRGIMGVARDMTEWIEARERERKQQEQLIQADKLAALGTLVAGMAHEINNPNNFIMLNATTLSKVWEEILPVLKDYHRRHGDFEVLGYGFPEIGDKFIKTCADIAEGARRIRGVVTELKQYARKEADDSLVLLDPNMPVASAVRLMDHAIRKATDRFRADYGRPDPVLGQYQQIEQVVVNLIQNACLSLPDRDCGLRIRTRNLPDQKEVLIEVSDEGEGISPEDQKQIFDPFFTTRRQAGGIGLGLAICETLTARHGGRLVFESAPGEGTTARVILPTAEPEAVSADRFHNPGNPDTD
jgi:PAS domain S-box-containing protein